MALADSPGTISQIGAIMTRNGHNLAHSDEEHAELAK
jgi:hypothetical protein